jgi:peptide/nickel transport system substrate-binding protein
MATAVPSGGAVPAQPEPRYGGTLRLLGPGGPDHLDTASAYYATSGQILRALRRQLFAYPAARDLSDARAAFTPVPDVAEEVPTVANGGLSADRLVYTIRVRRGVRWNAEPPREVTAQDYVRGFKRLANPVASSGALHYYTSTIAGMAEYCSAYERAFAGRQPRAEDLAGFHEAHEIAGLRCLDDRTLEITLRRPANDFLHILAMGFASAAPAEYERFLPDSESFRRNMISEGPYRITTYAPQAAEIVLGPNPAWRQESDPIRHQYLDAIHIRVAKERPETVRAMIDAGEIDLAWSFTVVSWGKPNRDGTPLVRSYPGFALNPYLVFNLQSPNEGGAMASRDVRRAIAYAIDKVAIGEILGVLDGVPSMPQHSVIPPGSVGHRDFDPYPTPGDRGDLARARRLLVDAGYPSLRLVAAVRDVGLHLEVMRSIARDLEQCGIELTFTTHSQAAYYGDLLGDPERARAGAWDIAEPGWTPDWFGNNGRAIVQPLFQTNARRGTTNYGGYSNPVVDATIERALEAPDRGRAETLWHEADRMIMDDVPIVPLLAFAAMTSRYHSRRVRNALHVPQIEFFDITNLWLDRPD